MPASGRPSCWYSVARLRRGLFACLLGPTIAIGTVTSVIADGAVSASAVKGVYLFNFASFVRWPNAAFSNRNADLVYCTLGRDDVVEVLPGILSGESVDGRRLTLRAIDGPDQLDGCHIAYLAAGADQVLPNLLRRQAGIPLLTVSSLPGFADRGGHIELDVVDRRVRPRIHAASVARSGLSISAQLYRLATIVDTDAPR